MLEITEQLKKNMETRYGC